ncbi:MAG: transposase [Planctomycetota bacterium]|jgi:REP element-mobilizing transposase RayT
MENIFYSNKQEKQITRGDLPHWSQCGKMHFVTFRLADSLPQEKLNQIKDQREKWHNVHELPYAQSEWDEYNRLFSEKAEKWLDSGYGECMLAQPECSKIVSDAIQFFNEERYYLDYWVIMPNHVHVLMIPMSPYTLKEILHSWKSFTSKTMNKSTGRSGEVWLYESFDHIVRSQRQLEKFRAYIVDNWKQTNETAIISRREFNVAEASRFGP